MILTGRAVVLALLGVVPVLLRPEPLTATLWLVLVVVVCVVDALLAASPRRLVLTRDHVGTIRAEATTTTRLQVHNPSRRTARGVLRDAWQPSARTSGERHRISVAPGASVQVETSLTPVRRGDRHTDLVTVRTLGPLRLAGRQASVDVPGTVRVLPPFHSRRHLPSRLARLRQIDGRSAVRVRGQGTEFDSLREYVEGDDVRSIDWRASARRSELVVRTWRPERDRRVTLVVDTSRLSAGRVDDTTRLDAAIEASLLLTALAAHAGDHVDLVAGDRVVRTQLAAVARPEMLAAMSDALATVQPAIVEADWQALAAAVARQARRPSLVVLLTPLEPAAVAESLLPVLPQLTRRQRVCIASCADPELDRMATARRTTDDAYRAAAAERTRTLRARTADALAGLGVTVVDAPPDALAPALADHYLTLKSRGLL
ncbi:DUF58 domain-containing protein [Arsenicicoccus sp. oral taxon 190]|uniref:DUF58 domain-containing protein n=1 Tax=Arsenicicoccus sp. oral taxon 190 TaxID=1658671 RepID=UPI000679F14E|nr:DUF58 domain-containing protein [Arsenicicoccus sp. oral taxon 190]AKT52421.1 lipoprotein [Arsenicicoccus sp. oral taxon 190]